MSQLIESEENEDEHQQSQERVDVGYDHKFLCL